MKPPMFVRLLTTQEKQHLEAALRSHDAFTLRRSRILLASAQGYRPSEIAPVLGCSAQAVRDVIHAFHGEALGCLEAKSRAPRRVETVWPRERDEELREMLHRSPRTFGKPRSTWTLELVAEVWFEQGITRRRLSGEAVRLNLKRLGINWKRAKSWMTSPDPRYAAKKARRDRWIRLAAKHADWVLVFEDEVWWSRLAQPSLRTWTEGPPMKVRVLKADDDDSDPDAICCYGMLRNDTGRVMLRFVEDRPLGEVTVRFLSWACDGLAEQGKKVLIVVWDEASWHRCDVVSAWLRGHNEQVARGGGLKIVICELPVASPWLNNIEPCWTHAKKAIMEPDRKLTANEVTARVCEHFGCAPLPYLKSEGSAEGAPPLGSAADGSDAKGSTSTIIPGGCSCPDGESP
jgi:transposase